MVRITNLDMTKEIVFDNKDYVLNEKDLGKVDIDLSTFNGFNQIGVNIVGRSIGSRDISIVGYVLADDEKEMLNKKRNLQRLVSPTEDFYLVIDNYKIRVAANSTIEYAVDYYENNKWLSKFLINGTCADPCFTFLYTDIVPIAFWRAGFHFPLNLAKPVVMGYREPSKIKMIENMGEVPTGIIIKMRVTKGTITNPYITSLLTNQTIKINDTLSPGEEIIINTNYGHKEITKNGKSIFHLMDIDSEFIQLQIGENYFIYGADTNDSKLEIDFEFSPKFLEV